MKKSHKATEPRSHGGKLLTALALLAAFSFVGCGRNEDISPPQITYGQTECEQCKMIVSEEPFAAAVVLVASEGVRKFAFDDIGCMLNFLRDQAPTGRVIAYVHDHPSRQWFDAAKAVFVHSDVLQTPMASHLAACESQAGAESLLHHYAGVSMTFAQLRTGVDSSSVSSSSMKERSLP